MPQKVTVFEFDVDKINQNPDDTGLNTIYKVKEYPKDYRTNIATGTTGTSITSLSPAQLHAYVTDIEATESTALDFIR